jgi:hypothetical protein
VDAELHGVSMSLGVGGREFGIAGMENSATYGMPDYVDYFYDHISCYCGSIWLGRRCKEGVRKVQNKMVL